MIPTYNDWLKGCGNIHHTPYNCYLEHVMRNRMEFALLMHKKLKVRNTSHGIQMSSKNYEKIG